MSVQLSDPNGTIQHPVALMDNKELEELMTDEDERLSKLH